MPYFDEPDEDEESSGECTCYSCTYESDEDENHVVINSYSYKPRPMFYGQGPVFLGVELELEAGDSTTKRSVADIAADGFGSLAYLKEDGSLNCGFEIVTHPMSPYYAIASANWQTLREIKSGGGYVRTDNNGLHVHVGRSSFTCTSHAFSWIKLFYRNEEMVTRIARRSSGQWASFSNHVRRTHKHTAKLTPDWLSRDISRDVGRYQAINTLPDSTFELRMFGSTLRPERVKGTLAFVAATIEYTRGLTANRVLAANGWSWPSFTRWLADSRDETFLPAIPYMESVCAF